MLSGFVGTSMAFTVLFPAIVGTVAPSRLVMIAVGWLFVVVEVARQASHRTAGLVFGLGSAYLGVVMSIALVGPNDDPMYAVNGVRLAITLPLYLLVGALLFNSSHRHIYARAFVAVAMLAAALAVVEAATATSVLGRDYDFARFQREGQARALVGSEQVLVFGTLLAGVVPLVRETRWRLAVLPSVILLAGSISSGSRGPTIIAILVIALDLVPPVVALIQRRPSLAKWASVVIVGGVLLASFVVWTPEVRGLTGAAYSSAYRAGIYALLPDILNAAPFGIGLGSIPYGVWLLPSELFGVRDLAATVDSELVYLAITFGWAGIALFVIAAWISAAGYCASRTFGLCALVITFSGLFVALHAWDSLGPLWYLAVGASVMAVRQKRRGHAPHDVHISRVTANRKAA
ncbi:MULTISPECIES: hypothetical protein [unclassified Micromonospora]|uniref:hypothetical protein n=1 Tax=unclassified Micromonospora TaxID=2617518 RepID=UPI002FF380B1